MNQISPARRIAVAGSQQRIGTTTQALQIALYLNSIGFPAAYVEMNFSGYIDNLISLYAHAEQEPKTCKTIYQGIDLFSRENLDRLRHLGYVFLVKDYGNCLDERFEELSFLEQEIKIYVCGTKPNEIYLTQNVVEKNYDREIGYIFSYTPKAERKGILQLMQEKASVTGFADYVSDPFCYKAQANQMYRKLLGV